MTKCGQKIGKLIFLERILEGESRESKITKFGSRFAKKSSSSEVEIYEFENRKKL